MKERTEPKPVTITEPVIDQLTGKEERIVIDIDVAEELQKAGWILADVRMRKTYRFLEPDKLTLEGN